MKFALKFRFFYSIRRYILAGLPIVEAVSGNNEDRECDKYPLARSLSSKTFASDWSSRATNALCDDNEDLAAEAEAFRQLVVKSNGIHRTLSNSELSFTSAAQSSAGKYKMPRRRTNTSVQARHSSRT